MQGTRMKRISRIQKMGLPAMAAIRPGARRVAQVESAGRSRRPGPAAAGPGALASSVVMVTSRAPGLCAAACLSPGTTLSLDDVGVEPGVDGSLLRTPGVRVDCLRRDRG